MRYVPQVQPELVVIYQATNDPVAALVFQDSYLPFLRLVREGYPAVRMVAVCPHNQGRYADAIKNAVALCHDSRIHFLDYTAGVIAPEDTSDGCHLNPGGAVRLGVRLAADLRRIAG